MLERYALPKLTIYALVQRQGPDEGFLKAVFNGKGLLAHTGHVPGPKQKLQQASRKEDADAHKPDLLEHRHVPTPVEWKRPREKVTVRVHTRQLGLEEFAVPHLACAAVTSA